MVSRFAISDGLNPLSFDGSGTRTIADQFTAPGNANHPRAFNEFNAFRPEGTFVTGAPRGDTHLLVVSSADGRNPALRNDLQIAPNGSFSASVTTGGISNFAGSLALSGSTVGTAQLDPALGAIAITSNLGSLGTERRGWGLTCSVVATRRPTKSGSLP